MAQSSALFKCVAACTVHRKKKCHNQIILDLAGRLQALYSLTLVISRWPPATTDNPFADGRPVYFNEPMYSCLVKETIWQQADKQGGFADLCYRAQADSAPRIGDELRDYDWFSGRLTNVIWNIDHDCFSCRVADEIPNNNGNYEYDYEWLITAALAAGYVVDRRSSFLIL